MSYLEFEKMLSVLLPSPGTVALTLTEVPEGDEQLTRFLESAISFGERQSSRLARDSPADGAHGGDRRILPRRARRGRRRGAASRLRELTLSRA